MILGLFNKQQTAAKPSAPPPSNASNLHNTFTQTERVCGRWTNSVFRERERRLLRAWTMRFHVSMGILYVLETVVLALLAGCQQFVHADSGALLPPEVSQHNGSLYAACKVKPSTSLPEGLPKVYGQVLFKQDHPQGKLKVLLRFRGLPRADHPQGRAVHIHQYGDLSRGCDSTGGHYNPHGVHHPNHPGDFGNILPQEGKIYAMVESEATLFGGLSVVGRAVVVHETTDDLGRGGDAGSLQHGNAGRRLGCCIIGLSSPALWNSHNKQYNRWLRRAGKP